MDWKSIYEKLKMGQLWSLCGVTLISAYTLPLQEISLIVICFYKFKYSWIQSFNQISGVRWYASAKNLLIWRIQQFLSLFANFRNFPIGSLIKKTMIWGNVDEFSTLLNFKLICMKCVGWNINQRDINLWEIITQIRSRWAMWKKCSFILPQNMAWHAYLLPLKI